MKNDVIYSRQELLDMGFKYVGENTKIFKKSILVNCQNIYLGDACQIDDLAYIVASGPIHVGKRVHIACLTSFIGGGEIILEDYSSVAAGSRLISGTDDFLGEAMVNPCIPNKYRKTTRSFIHMKKHSLLGTNTIVHPGITIGEGTTTGSGTIVTKDLEEWGIYIGSPAKRVKERRKDIILTYEKQLIEEFGY